MRKLKAVAAFGAYLGPRIETHHFHWVVAFKQSLGFGIKNVSNPRRKGYLLYIGSFFPSASFVVVGTNKDLFVCWTV